MATASDLKEEAVGFGNVDVGQGESEGESDKPSEGSAKMAGSLILSSYRIYRSKRTSSGYILDSSRLMLIIFSSSNPTHVQVFAFLFSFVVIILILSHNERLACFSGCLLDHVVLELICSSTPELSKGSVLL